MLLTSNGLLGLGTTIPMNTLDVATGSIISRGTNSSNIGIYSTTSNGNSEIYFVNPVSNAAITTSGGLWTLG